MSDNKQTMKTLSPQENKTWEYILKYIEDYKVVPSNKQIADHLGLKYALAKQRVNSVLRNIEDKKSVRFSKVICVK